MARGSRSLKTKLILMIMAVSTASLMATSVMMFTYEYFWIQMRIKQNLEIVTRILAANSTAALSFGDSKAAEELLAALDAQPAIEAGCIYDKDGRPLASYLRGGENAGLPGRPGADGFHIVDGRLFLATPIVFKGERLGTIYVRSDYSNLYTRLKTLSMVAIVALVISSILALAMTTVLQRRFLQPISSLGVTARKVAESKDYTIRAEKFNDDEFGFVITQFNEMLDLIERRRMELLHAHDELEQRVIERTKELQTANKELESFSYSVSHDLRAPLRHIGGFMNMLRKHAGPKLDEKANRYMNTISDSATQMGTLIDDLLSFSRMSRTEMHVGAVNLDELLDDVIRTMPADPQPREIVWKRAALPVVHGDRALLRQVFVNLVSNAIKYSRTREKSQIEVGTRQENGEHIVFVKDNGVGFDMKYVDKLFGVFHRLHSAEQFEGTGIGLANVRRIIMRHRGRTWAEGEIDLGATIYFSIPNHKENGA